MNIGIDLRCLQSPHRTGVGEYAFELLSAIFRIDQKNHYYLFFNSFLSDDQIDFNFPNVHSANFKYPNKLLNLCSLILGLPKVDKLIRSKFNLEKLDYFFSPNLNYISLSPSCKHLLTIHDLSFELFPNFLTIKQLAWHRLARTKYQCINAETIVTPSENTRRDLINYFHLPPKKIKTIYPGLSYSFSKSSALPKFSLPDKYILFLGTLEPRKNISTLIRAYEYAQNKLPEKYDLVIAGAPGWKNENVKKLVNQSTLKKQIHFFGFVSDEVKPNLYKKSSLFVYPSFYEGFGFPVLEAMAAGVPVITSNRSSLPEITNGAAYLVNPHRPEEIAEGIIKILTSKELSSGISSKGRAQALKFDWNTSAKEWLKLIS